MKAKATTLHLLLSVICMLNSVHGFTVPKPAAVQHKNAAYSNLFSLHPITPGEPFRRSKANSVPRSIMKMTEEAAEEENQGETVTDAEDSEAKGTEVAKKEKERSGLVTALILGPPLLAKFMVVLIVKFLTDIVVFPLLFLYRICKSAKNKVVGLFVKDDIMKGEKVNGNHS